MQDATFPATTGTTKKSAAATPETPRYDTRFTGGGFQLLSSIAGFGQ